MQSQTYFGADSLIHSLLMRYLDREAFDVHVACNVGTRDDPSASYKALSKIPDLHFRPTQFGPSVNYRSKREIAKETFLGALPSAASLLSLAGYIKKNQIDIIHCTEKPRDAFIGFLLSRMTGAKCVVHLHVKAEGWISPLVQWSMRHAVALIGVSAFVAESMIAMGFQPEKVHFVLNALDLSGWSPEKQNGAIRHEFGIPPDAPLLAIVSRLFYWKGHTELIKALARVKAESPHVKLLVVGEDDPRGMPGRGSYTSELKSLVNDLDLTDQVIFTGFRGDVHQILSACDLYTMPSFEEPFGMVFLEAMAMKKPVVALDNGGTREVIEDEKSGLLSLPQDIEGLATNIVRLIQDPDLRLRLGEYGRCRVETYFTPQRMACDAGNIYQELVFNSRNQRLRERR